MLICDAPGFPVHVYDRGDGPVVVFLHGGLESTADHHDLLEALGSCRRVVGPDRRGHGRTADVAGAYTYSAMVDETAAVIDALCVGAVDVVGFSDGANIGIELALQRSDLVRSLVAISGNLDAEGLEPNMRERLAHPDPDSPGLQQVRDAHAVLSPDGADHWSTFHRKVCAMGATGPHLSLNAIGSIACPVLVVSGDDDVVQLEHTVDLYRALPDAQLAVVPGTSHLLLHEKPTLLADLVTSFLTEPEPHRLLPMRRLPPI